jgi:hypothetical protein
MNNTITEYFKMLKQWLKVFPELFRLGKKNKRESGYYENLCW